MRSREAPLPIQGKGLPEPRGRSGTTLFPPMPLQTDGAEFKKIESLCGGGRGPEVVRVPQPWMDFYMLRAIRKIPVQKSWTKYVIDRDWCRVPKGTPGPPGLHDCTFGYATRDACARVWPEETAPGGMDIWEVS